MSELLISGKIYHPTNNKRALLVESVGKNNIIMVKEIRKQVIKKWISSGLLDGIGIIDRSKLGIDEQKASVAELYESEASMLLRCQGLLKN
jgi:hypothetical protein